MEWRGVVLFFGIVVVPIVVWEAAALTKVTLQLNVLL